ncbi:MAG TPA: lamin tail domain-containing protein, partial [Verrucomicrobiales bacterium]|nr:lamin tail domain-containing protein [Verrucomicrobiales bacterium]
VAWNQAATAHNASTDGGFFGNPQAGITTSFSIDKSRLRAGTNVIAAQLHNSATNSSDLMLDVRLTAAGPSPISLVGKDSLWKYFIPTAEFASMPAATASSGPAFLDWLELYNPAATAVPLAGWALSDDSAVPMKWVFPPAATIPANGFLTVACSGRDLKPASGMLHTNFSLDQDGESITLRNASGTVVHQVTQVPDQDFFHTWGRDPVSGQMRYFDTATPGAPNTGTTFTAVAARPGSDKETGFYNSPFSINLTTSTPGATIRYTLDGSDPTSSSAVYTGALDPTPPLSAGPGLGYILREVWYNSSGVFTPPASIPVGNAPAASSAITAFESPTNVADWYSQRVRGILQVTQTGTYTFYLATDDDGELYLSQSDSPAGKTRIAYIQSNWAGVREWNKFPSQHSVPLTLTAGQRYYIEALESEGSGGDNLAVGWTGPGFPSITVIPGNFLSPPDGITAGVTLPTGCCVRARAWAPGMVPSEIMTRNYALNYPAGVRTSPAIFLTGEAGRTFYKPNGVFSIQGGSWATGDWVPGTPATDYNFCLMRGEAFERPAVMEVVRPDNTLRFRTTVGARFAGSPWSRPKYLLSDIDTANWNSAWTTKPQVNLFFRGDLGMSRLHDEGFIPGSVLNEWDTLRLRAGKNDAYNPFIIDEWMRRTYRSMGNHPSPLGFFSTVFLNGKLKSYFNPTERPRDTFFQEFYDTPNAWDVNYIGEWESGDTVAYNLMYNYFRNTDFTMLANYLGGAALWDPVNAADYYLLNGWGATKDWPGNNYVFARERAAGKQWRFSMWDAEGAMGMFGQTNTANTFTEDLMINAPASETFIMRLVFLRFNQSPEWKMLFADRLQKHFFNGGALQQTTGQTRWNSLRDQVKPAITALHGSAFYEGNWTNWANRIPTFLTQ